MENVRHNGSNILNFQAKYIVEELQALMQRVYADMDVPRERINAIAEKGRELARTPDNWPKGKEQAMPFLNAVDGLAKKINQLLDYKALKEEGLIRAVPM